MLKFKFLSLVCLLALFACNPNSTEQTEPQTTQTSDQSDEKESVDQTASNVPSGPKGLKDYYADYFDVGVSVAPRHFNGPDADLIKKEFNSLTAENIMKMGPIHPTRDVYMWNFSDQLMEFANENDMKVRGHALCWHNQVGDWMFKENDGSTVSKEELLTRLREHIFQVVTEYKDDVFAWDVVNEAISDNPEEMYRKSEWYEICGEDFIFEAFKYAHEADPDALLFYNDYSAVVPHKRDRIVKMLKKMKAEGIPVHGMGIQGHWSVYEPSEKDLRDALDAYKALGLQIHITELDISVYEKEHTRRAKTPEDDDTFTNEMRQKQVDQYEMVFRVFRDYKDDISSVTFWNISDYSSWLDNFPVQGRKDYPLLFDQNRQRKQAYRAVTNF